MNILERIKIETKKIQLMEYSVEYSERAKEKCKTQNQVMSAKEHEEMSMHDMTKFYTSRDAIIRWYFSYLGNMKKLEVVSIIGDYVKKNDIKRVVSLGAGPGMLEVLLKSVVSRDVSIVATDYDGFFVEQGKKFFPELQWEKYDFNYNDNDNILKHDDKTLIVLIGSSCSMSNDGYLNFLERMNRNGIKHILLFEAGIFSAKEYIWKLLFAIKSALLNKTTKDVSTVHAYQRTTRMIRHIYRKSGFEVFFLRKSTNNSFMDYRYIVLLRG